MGTRADPRRHPYDPAKDPMSGMPPEDRKEAHRLFMVTMRSPSGSARWREARRRYAELMVRHGIWPKEALDSAD